MEPLTTIELETCTLVELVTLFCTIEAELWVGSHDTEERKTNFANQEKIRRALSRRNGRSR